MATCIGSQRGPELPLVVSTQQVKMWSQPALCSLPHCFSAALSDQVGGMLMQGTGKVRTVLVMVWLCLSQGRLHAQVLASAARLGAAFSTQKCALARMVVARPMEAAVAQRGLPSSAGAVFSSVCGVSQPCALTGASVPSLYLRAVSVLPGQGAGVPQ